MVKSAKKNNQRAVIVSSCCCIILLGASTYVDPSLGITGVVFILVCIYFLIRFGLREKWESEQELSAYSVFNENNRTVAGSFTAQQLDDQLRHRHRSSGEGEGEGGGGAAWQGRMRETRPLGAVAESPEVWRRRREAAALAAEKRAKGTLTENQQ